VQTSDHQHPRWPTPPRGFPSMHTSQPISSRAGPAHDRESPPNTSNHCEGSAGENPQVISPILPFPQVRPQTPFMPPSGLLTLVSEVRSLLGPPTQTHI